MRDNVLSGFWCNGATTRSIYFGHGSGGTTLDANRIDDYTIGIQLGVFRASDPLPPDIRIDADSYCGGEDFIDHAGGVVRNNILLARGDYPAALDAGIAAWNVCDLEIVHNTVFNPVTPVISSLEWRWPDRGVVIKNSLVSYIMVERQNERTATVNVQANIERAASAVFVDTANGDLHLADGASPVGVGAPLSAGECDADYDGDSPDLARPDVGADEAP